MKTLFWRSLRFQIPVLVFVGVVPPMIIALVYTGSQANRIIRRETKQNMAAKTEALADSVSRWKETYVLAVQNLSQQPEIVSMDARRQKPVLMKTAKVYQYPYIIQTVDRNGFNVARSDRKKGNYLGDRVWFKDAKAGKEISYQTLIGRTNNKPSMCLGAPIRDDAAIVKGVAGICTDLEAVGKQVGAIRFGKTGYAFLVDSSGRILAHPDPQLSSGKELVDLSYYPPVEKLLQKHQGYFNFQDRQKIEWFSYIKRLDNNWGVILLQQKDEFFAKEREFQQLVLLVTGLAILGTGILTWFIAKRIVNPIAQLTTAATNIAEGNLSQRVRLDRQNELGILARSFDLMAQQLEDSFVNLEHTNQDLETRVRERTKELEKAREDSELANRVKSQFLANMSHELRTPLNGILGYAQILQNDLASPNHLIHSIGKQVDGLRIIHENGKYLLTLINDILDLSKIEANKLEIHPSPVYLPGFLQGTTDIIRPQAAAKDIFFNFQFDDNLPTGIQTDEKRLRQILLNLLSNAVKFTDRGGVTLKVSVVEQRMGVGSRESGTGIDRDNVGGSQAVRQQTKNNSNEKVKIRFEVIDTGIGLSSSELSKIFQPFEQSGSLDRRFSGAGLGLAIGKQLVELMGGNLKVTSHLGSGSIFWFDLSCPVIEIEPPLEQKTFDIILDRTSKPPQILVVDDVRENRLVLLNMLTPWGFEVLTAENGERGLEIARKTKPDLILTDLFMRVKTGFAMVRELRQIPELANLPIVAVSANNFEAVQQESKEAGCDAFLLKPIEQKQLLSILGRYLNLQPLQ
jgi:signal transduction histidine kinase/ActR/RegA family two-component response regulator